MHRDRGASEDLAAGLVDLLSTAGPSGNLFQWPFNLMYLTQESHSRERSDPAYPVPFPAALLEHMEWRMGNFPKEKPPSRCK